MGLDSGRRSAGAPSERAGGDLPARPVVVAGWCVDRLLLDAWGQGDNYESQGGQLRSAHRAAQRCRYLSALVADWGVACLRRGRPLAHLARWQNPPHTECRALDDPRLVKGRKENLWYSR